MSKMIQIRDVPDEIHGVLRTRAAQAGLSLSDYLLQEVTRIAQRPTIEELTRRIRARGAANVRESSARAVRAERGGRR
jgi:antitoxin FitA